MDPRPVDVMSELAVRWYVQMLDAGMSKCEERGIELTFEQRFVVLTAAQLALGDWSEPLPNE